MLSWRVCNTWVFKLRFWNEGECPVCSLAVPPSKQVTCQMSYTASHHRQSAHPSLVFHTWTALDCCLYNVRHLRNVTVMVIWAEKYRPQYGKLGCRQRIAPAQCYGHRWYNDNQSTARHYSQMCDVRFITAANTARWAKPSATGQLTRNTLNTILPSMLT